MGRALTELREEKAIVTRKATLMLKRSSGNETLAEIAELGRLVTRAEDLNKQINAMKRATGEDAPEPTFNGPESRAAYKGLFGIFLRKGLQGMGDSALELFRGLAASEARAMGVAGGDSSAVGFWVPAQYNDAVVSAMRSYSPLLATDAATATGAPYRWPLDNDVNGADAEAAIISENSDNAGASSADVEGVSVAVLGAYKYSTKVVKVTYELLQDAFSGFEEYLKGRFAVRLARGITKAATKGSGTGEPLGFLNDSRVRQVTSGATGSVTPADVAALLGAVDAAYAASPSATFFATQDTLTSMRAAVASGSGLPLFPSLQFGDRLLGKPVHVLPYMEEIGAGARTLAFGDWSSLVYRHAPLTVTRFSERYVENGVTGFLGILRADTQLVIPPEAGSPAVKDYPVAVLVQKS